MADLQSHTRPKTFQISWRRKIRSAVLLSSIIILHACGADEKPTQSAQVTFPHPYYTPTTGRVGYHMTSTLYLGQDPPSECRMAYRSVFVMQGASGPPGLTLPHTDTANWTVIEGTPRQAGDWTFDVVLKEITCCLKWGARGTDCEGPRYGDRVIPVHIHIDP